MDQQQPSDPQSFGTTGLMGENQGQGPPESEQRIQDQSVGKEELQSRMENSSYNTSDFNADVFSAVPETPVQGLQQAGNAVDQPMSANTTAAQENFPESNQEMQTTNVVEQTSDVPENSNATETFQPANELPVMQQQQQQASDTEMVSAAEPGVPLASGESQTPVSSEPLQPTTTTTTSEQKPPAPAASIQDSSIISAPASWQIPPGALQAKTENFAAPIEPVNKANIKRERLEQRVAESEYDANAWSALINEVQLTGDLAATREVYERVLQVFPTSPRFWLSYLELELKYSNFSEVESLFTRCLKTVLSVDLWKFYLGYIRRINQGESGSAATPEARAIIEKAYEYVLNNVGIDRDAGPIWADYIFFLKSAETTNTWEEQRKMDSMRRAYQKAITIPLNNVEHLWKEYDQWENNLNRLTAKKFLGEKSSAYMTARSALREMRSLTENLNRMAVAKPPTWTKKEIQQLEQWKEYIKWEKKNPLQLDDENAVIERVAYAYQQAFLVLRFYPELWYDFANYYIELGKPEKAMGALKQGIEVMPTSLLLNFAYAELCESRRQLDEARQTFDSLLEHLDKDIEKIKTRAQSEIDKIQKEADEEKANMNLSDDIDGELREQLRTREKQIKKEQEAVEERMKKEVDVIAKACSLVWISYMRFARRTEGIKAARVLFSRARKSPNRTYHVFVASALMEYHNSKDATVAGRVFELGLKSFADDPAYVCEYLDFLIQLNDDNNTRALFGRTLATMPPSKAEPIWSKFLDYENKYGDLQGIQSVEKRRKEAIPSISTLSSFLQRYSYLGVDSISELELGGEARGLKPLEATKGVAAPSAVTTTAPAPEEPIRAKEQTKRPLLEAVHPERYPRPDLSQWQAFKPTETRRPLPPASAPVIPSPTVAEMPPIPPVPPAVGSVPPPVTKDLVPPPVAAPTQPTAAWHAPPAGPPLSSLPEPVAYFVSRLPPAHSFDGPTIQPGELVDLLRNVIIPLPPQGAPSTMPPSGRGPPKGMGGPAMPPPPGRDMPPARGVYGSPRGRTGGGFKPRPSGTGRGGKQGVKRRARDDFDDEFTAHKGMGPNRPPTYDIFRARQAKRHRDDVPPY